MNSYERIKRMYEHKEADRIPIIDDPWAGTIRRWHREGMPAGMDWCDYFDVDKIGVINIDISPRMPVRRLEENDRWYIETSSWGVTMKHFKEEDSTPEFLDFTITTEEAWEKAKKQMTVEDDRIPWQMLKDNYDQWRAEGRWLRGVFWFGFDVTHSWMMGTENPGGCCLRHSQGLQSDGCGYSAYYGLSGTVPRHHSPRCRRQGGCAERR